LLPEVLKTPVSEKCKSINGNRHKEALAIILFNGIIFPLSGIKIPSLLWRIVTTFKEQATFFKYTKEQTTHHR
jgi:hypothetical protein